MYSYWGRYEYYVQTGYFYRLPVKLVNVGGSSFQKGTYFRQSNPQVFGLYHTAILVIINFSKITKSTLYCRHLRTRSWFLAFIMALSGTASWRWIPESLVKNNFNSLFTQAEFFCKFLNDKTYIYKEKQDQKGFWSLGARWGFYGI